MSKQLSKSIIDSVVTKAVNAALGNGKKKQKQPKSNQSNAAPISQSVNFKSKTPKFRNRSATSCRIQHEEMVGSVRTSIPWSVDTYSLNPGLQGTFMWLSSQARGWEKYKFHSLKFTYRTRCATTQAGSISMFPDYDPSDPEPTSEQIASTYQGFSDDAYWKPQEISLNHSQLIKERYVRHVNRPSDMSLADYDLGNLFVGSVGATSNEFTTGKIYVEYDVEFSVPVLDNAAANSSNNITMFSNDAATLSNTDPFGPARVVSNDFSSYDIAINGNEFTISNLTPGVSYFVSVQQEGTGFATNAGMIKSNVTVQYSGIDALQGTTKYVYTDWFTPSVGHTTCTFEEAITTQTTIAYSVITFGKVNFDL